MQPSEEVDSGNREAEAPLVLDGSAVTGVQSLQAASSNERESARPLVEGGGSLREDKTTYHWRRNILTFSLGRGRNPFVCACYRKHCD